MAMSFEVSRQTGETHDAGNDREKEPGFALDFYVTDHSADNAETGDPERLR